MDEDKEVKSTTARNRRRRLKKKLNKEARKRAECLNGGSLVEVKGEQGWTASIGTSEADLLKKGAEWLIGRPLDGKTKHGRTGEECGFEEVALRKGAEWMVGRPLEESRDSQWVTRGSSQLTEADIVKKGAEWLIGRPLEDRSNADDEEEDSSEALGLEANLVRMGAGWLVGRPLEQGTGHGRGLSEVDLLMKGAEWLVGRPLEGSTSREDSGVSQAALLRMGTELFLRRFSEAGDKS